MFRRIETMPFSRESSELFDRPSINLGRIVGGRRAEQGPRRCSMDVDIRYLPNQDPGEILEQIRAIPDIEVERTFIFPPAHVSRTNPYVRALCEVVARLTDGASVSVGRDGASDAVSFLRAGIPAVEFGPAGAGHHGPEEWARPLARPLPGGARRLRARRPPRLRRGREGPCGGRGRGGVTAGERPPRSGCG